jgi:hypothetical protein
LTKRGSLTKGKTEMPETVVRPLPVPSDVAVRSALLALANLGAELQTYNEEARTIVARMPKWFGVKKSTILVRVQDYGDNCRMEIELPDKGKSDELFNQISLYLVDGHRAAGDMTMRWVEKQEQSLAYTTGQTVAKALKRFKPAAKEAAGSLATTTTTSETATAEEKDLLVVEAETEEVEADSAEATPEMDQGNSNFIIVHPEAHQVDLKVDPEVFADRSSYLETCAACQAVVLRGSQFCGNCGRPVTMKAISKEVNEGSRNTARSSIIFGGLAMAFQVVALYFLVIAPIVVTDPETGAGVGLTTFNLFLGLALGLIPSLLIGNEARRMAKTAEVYLNFRFNKDQEGSTLTKWGRYLGWASIYISIGWIVFLAARNLM